MTIPMQGTNLLIFRPHSPPSSKFSIETLQYEINSVVMEKYEFE